MAHFGLPDTGAGVDFFLSYFCVDKLFQGALRLQKKKKKLVVECMFAELYTNPSKQAFFFLFCCFIGPFGPQMSQDRGDFGQKKMTSDFL